MSVMASFQEFRIIRLFVQHIVRLTTNEILRAHISVPLWAEPTDDRWISPPQRASNAASISLALCHNFMPLFGQNLGRRLERGRLWWYTSSACDHVGCDRRTAGSRGRMAPCRAYQVRQDRGHTCAFSRASTWYGWWCQASDTRCGGNSSNGTVSNLIYQKRYYCCWWWCRSDLFSGNYVIPEKRLINLQLLYWLYAISNNGMCQGRRSPSYHKRVCYVLLDIRSV